MTSPSPNSVTEHGTSDRESVIPGATLGPHLEAATPELGDGLALPLSHELDVLYDPLASESGTRATPRTEAYAIIEYDLSSISQALSMV